MAFGPHFPLLKQNSLIMKPRLVRIDLIINEVAVKFCAHPFIETCPYKAMLMFQASNADIMNDISESYRVFLKWEDGTTTEEYFSGMNASAVVSGYLEDILIPDVHFMLN